MIRTETLLNELFRNPRSIVLVTDEHYNIRYASENVESIFGIKPVSVLGRNGFDFVPVSKVNEWKLCLEAANHNTTQEISLMSSSGIPLHFDVTVTNHINHQGIRGLVVFMHDVTDRTKMVKELESHNEQLDHFIFKTTHDLRAPVRSALGLIALAEHEPEAFQKYLSLIKSSLSKLDGMIEEVNSFYRNEKLAVQNEWIDLRSLVKAEMENLSNVPEAAGIHMDVFISGEVPFYSDSLRIRTVIANLISNSIKYCDPTKYVKYIQVSAHIFHDKAFISVEDNGVGIEEQYHEKIFDLFFRAHLGSKGSGLGLYIVKDTLERLGGSIYVKSKPGIGTTFTITVPNTPGSAILN